MEKSGWGAEPFRSAGACGAGPWGPELLPADTPRSGRCWGGVTARTQVPSPPPEGPVQPEASAALVSLRISALCPVGRRLWGCTRPPTGRALVTRFTVRSVDTHTPPRAATWLRPGPGSAATLTAGATPLTSWAEGGVRQWLGAWKVKANVFGCQGRARLVPRKDPVMAKASELRYCPSSDGACWSPAI